MPDDGVGVVNDGSLYSENSGRFGTAAEHLVAASCILSSRFVLNVSTAFVDDEGVDLVFHRRGGAATLPVQVKARSTDTKGISAGTFVQQARVASFRPRRDLYMLFVVIDPDAAQIKMLWLVPSHDFDKLANTTGKGYRRITASMKPGAKDKWSAYRMPFPELAPRLLALLDEIEHRQL